MSDGEFGNSFWLSILSHIGTALLTGGGLLWKMSGRFSSFATKDEVAADYVSKELFNEFKGNIQTDIAEIKTDIKDARAEIIREIRRRSDK